MMGRRLLRAVAQAMPEEPAQRFVLKHLVTAPEAVQAAYSEMLEDMCEYRSILIEVGGSRTPFFFF